jgi:coenzyme F420-reducing hydrogenase beta subunit
MSEGLTVDVAGVAALDQCCQCGACAVVCRNVELVYSESHPLNDVFPLAKKSTACESCVSRLCVEVCPLVTPASEAADWLGPSAKPSDIGANVLRSYVAHAASPLVRQRAASGGVVTAILAEMLSSDRVDAVVTVDHAKDGKGGSEFRCVRDIKELEQTQSSVYTPVFYGEAVRELLDSDETFAIVGRPCQLRAVENLKRIHPSFGDRLACTISLFCAWHISRVALKHLASIAYKNRSADFDHVAFREGDWPGRLVFSKNNERTEFPYFDLNSTNGTYYYPLVAPFIPDACARCFDVLGEFGDVSVGDPWNLGLEPGPNKGYSLVVVRTERGQQAFDACLDSSAVEISHEISIAQLAQSQGNTIAIKKSGAFLRSQKCLAHERSIRRLAWTNRWYGMIARRIRSPRYWRIVSRIYLAIIWRKLRSRLDPALYVSGRRRKTK